MQYQSSKLVYVLFSFLSILTLRFASSSNLVFSTVVERAECVSLDQPNPIAAKYPNNATGTLNGTISIVALPLETARQLIPSQYRILEHAYRHILPSFPKGMYPALIQAVYDHDVQAFGVKIGDFARAGVEFPFVDLLGDNSTSFKWVPSLLMTAGNTIALQGAAEYGTITIPANFDPPCDAYRAAPDSKDGSTTIFSAKSASNVTASVSTSFSAVTEEKYPLAFYVNVTNQPIFADGKKCDQMLRFFNTSVSTAPYKIQPVKGSIKAHIAPFTKEQEWTDVYGIRTDTSFLENNYLSCESLRGYTALVQ